MNFEMEQQKQRAAALAQEKKEKMLIEEKERNLNKEKYTNKLKRLVDSIAFFYSNQALQSFQPSTIGIAKKQKDTGKNKTFTNLSEATKNGLVYEQAQKYRMYYEFIHIDGHTDLDVILKKATIFRFTQDKVKSSINFSDLRTTASKIDTSIIKLKRDNTDGKNDKAIRELEAHKKEIDKKMTEFAESNKNTSSYNQLNTDAMSALKILSQTNKIIIHKGDEEREREISIPTDNGKLLFDMILDKICPDQKRKKRTDDEVDDYVDWKKIANKSASASAQATPQATPQSFSQSSTRTPKQYTQNKSIFSAKSKPDNAYVVKPDNIYISKPSIFSMPVQKTELKTESKFNNNMFNKLVIEDDDDVEINVVQDDTNFPSLVTTSKTTITAKSNGAWSSLSVTKKIISKIENMDDKTEELQTKTSKKQDNNIINNDPLEHLFGKSGFIKSVVFSSFDTTEYNINESQNDEYSEDSEDNEDNEEDNVDDEKTEECIDYWND